MSEVFGKLITLEQKPANQYRRMSMSGNIFDNMDDETAEFEDRSGSQSADGFFTVQFGTENVQVAFRAGMTVKDAFIMNSDFLGFDPDRALAYRDNTNNLLDGHETPEVGMVYSASITYDEKG